jgi:hypothetical protein
MDDAEAGESEMSESEPEPSVVSESKAEEEAEEDSDVLDDDIEGVIAQLKKADEMPDVNIEDKK